MHVEQRLLHRPKLHSPTRYRLVTSVTAWRRGNPVAPLAHLQTPDHT